MIEKELIILNKEIYLTLEKDNMYGFGVWYHKNKKGEHFIELRIWNRFVSICIW